MMTTEIYYTSYENWIPCGEVEGEENNQKATNCQTKNNNLANSPKDLQLYKVLHISINPSFYHFSILSAPEEKQFSSQSQWFHAVSLSRSWHIFYSYLYCNIVTYLIW